LKVTVLLIGAGLLAPLADAQAIEVNDLSRCRAVAGVAERAACYDRIVDDAVSKGETSTARAAPPPAASKFAPQIKTVALTKATRAASGRAVLVTSEGETWLQTEGEAPVKLPEAGAQITIRKGAMGGFFCLLDRYTSVRCTQR
jgi:hypothetical protein